jgi:hypothetical protein
MDENFDIEKIMNVVNIVKNISQNNPQNNEMDETKEPESNIVSSPLNTIKAAIPYLDEKYQKNIGIMVKLIEIDRLVNNFQAMSIEDGDNKRPIKMLQAVKPQLDIKKQKIVDIFVRVIEIKELMEGLSNV